MSKSLIEDYFEHVPFSSVGVSFDTLEFAKNVSANDRRMRDANCHSTGCRNKIPEN